MLIMHIIFYSHSLISKPPHVKPAPIAGISTKSPFLILPECTDSEKARGTEAADVLP